jgi:hypothetical protein
VADDEMLARRKLGDRRGKPRFDVVGELPGTLETVLRLTMANIGSGGALLQSHVALAQDSVHKVTLSAGGQDFITPVKVRHVREMTSADGERGFLIGVEFIALDPVLLGHMAQLMGSADGQEA